jgi:signal transduction histidine kinase
MLIQSIDTLSNKFADKDPESASELASLHYEASRLNTNLLQVLSLYRSEKNQLPLNIDEHYIDDLVDELIAKNTIYIKNNNHEVEFDIQPDLCWYFDLDMIISLLNDIFINALRYSHGKIKITAKQLDQELQITIQDNGDGYPDNMMVSSGTEMRDLNLASGRTGLGLFFAKLIAAAHSNQSNVGRISLTNGGELGGSVFILTLP